MLNKMKTNFETEEDKEFLSYCLFNAIATSDGIVRSRFTAKEVKEIGAEDFFIKKLNNRKKCFEFLGLDDEYKEQVDTFIFQLSEEPIS